MLLKLGIPLLLLLMGAGVVLMIMKGAGPPLPGAVDPTQPPERIVLIVIDTLRQDFVGAYRSESKPLTPNIDALAGAGQRFENAYASFHQTTMSMASLFTGHTPSLESGDTSSPLEWNGRNWCGMRRFASDRDAEACIPEALPTLAQKLSGADYWTAGIATNALMFAPLGYERGFDTWLEVGGKKKAEDDFGAWNFRKRGAKATTRALREVLRQRPSDRFFLYLHFMDVHDYAIDDSVGYAGAVTNSDRGVGEVLTILQDEGLLDGSVVFLVSDHGERLGEEHLLPGMRSHFGNPSFEEHLRIPFIVAPAIIPEADGFLRSDDIHRLIANLGVGSHAAGMDLAPEEHFTSEVAFQTYMDGGWKSFRRRSDDAMFLVDLDADPEEAHDLAQQHPEIAARHRIRMNALSRELAAGEAPPTAITPEDQARLRELGYLE